MTRRPSYEEPSRNDLDRLQEAAREDALGERTAAERRGRGERQRAVGSSALPGEEPSGAEPQESPFSESSDGEASFTPPLKSGSWWVKRSVGQVLSGNILTQAEVRRMYPYVLFIAVLMFLYIANGYHIQKLHRRHDRISAQIKELRSRSLTLSSIRMTATRQSEIIKELELRGIPLRESLSPPKIIDK